MIGDNHKISADKMNVILYRRSITKDGKYKGSERWLVVGHYPTHKAALHAMINIEMIAVPQYYSEIVAKIDELHAKIDSISRN